MAYATYADVQLRIGKTFNEQEQTKCTTLLDDAAVLIDGYNSNASADAKKIVSCRIVGRIMVSNDMEIPMGATQGSQSGLGYSESWTIGSGGSSGELYLGQTDKKYLGGISKIGSYSPIQEMVPYED